MPVNKSKVEAQVFCFTNIEVFLMLLLLRGKQVKNLKEKRNKKVKWISMIAMTFMLSFMSIGCSKLEDDKAKKVFDRIVELGKEKNKGCASALLDEEIYTKSLNDFNVSERQWASYMNDEKGKETLSKWLANCMMANYK